MGMGQFKKRGNAKSPITAVITAVITAREYYREAPWYFLDLCDALLRDCSSAKREGLRYLHMYNGNVQQSLLCAAPCVIKDLRISSRFSPMIFHRDANSLLLGAF